MTSPYLPTAGTTADPQWNGVYAAKVAIVTDPLNQGRVQMIIPQVLGTGISNWALPMQPGIVPAVGTTCLALFLGGNINAPYYFLGVSSALIEAVSSPTGLLNANPLFVGGTIAPWTATGGSLNTTEPNPDTSPPYTFGALWVASGSGGGYVTEVADPFTSVIGQPYQVQAWVYYPLGGNVSVGFGWTGQANTTTTVTVPAGAWALVSTVQTATATSGWPLVGPVASTTGDLFTAEGIMVTGQIPGQIISAGSISQGQVNFTARQIGGISTTIAGSAPVGALAGDLWFDSAAGYQLYQYSGTSWNLFQFGTGALAVGSITAAIIAANTITAAQIASGTITATQIAANTITASQIAANTITTAQLTATAINGMTITGATVITDSGTGGVFVYSGLPTTGNLIVSMAAASGTDAFSNSYPEGFGVSAGAIAGSMLGPTGLVLNTNPYLLNGDAVGWTSAGSSAFSITNVGLPTGTPYAYAAKFTSNGTHPGLVEQTLAVAFGVVVANQYLVSAWVYSPNTSIEIGLSWYQSNKTTLISTSTQTFTIPASTWTTVSAVVTAPALAAYAFPVVGPTVPSSGNVTYAEGITVVNQIPGGILVPASVTASQIATATITNTNLAASVTARSIGGILTTIAGSAPSSPTAGDVWINSSNGYQINQYSGSAWTAVTFTGSDVIAASTITASQIAANTITAGQIAAGTITASQIAASTITAGKLVSGITVSGIVDATTVNAGTYISTSAQGEFLAYSTSSPSSGNLVNSIAGSSGSDGSGNSYPAGFMGDQVTLNNNAAPPSFSGASVLFSDGNGRLRWAGSAGGTANVVDRSVVNVAQFTVGNTTSLTQISATFSYIGGESNQSSMFEQEISGVGTWATTGLKNLLFVPAVDGVAIGGGANITWDSTGFTGGNTFGYTIKWCLAFLSQGSGATVNVAMSGTLNRTGAPFTTGASMTASGNSAGFSMDSTVNHTYTIFAGWAATSAGQTITTNQTRQTRYD